MKSLKSVMPEKIKGKATKSNKVKKFMKAAMMSNKFVKSAKIQYMKWKDSSKGVRLVKKKIKTNKKKHAVAGTGAIYTRASSKTNKDGASVI